MASSNLPNNKLSVFLCHAVEDKPEVRKLYKRLKEESWIDPWLDEEKLLLGQDWNMAILEALRKVHVIIICLSKTSVVKEGYVQKEIKRALDFSEEKPDGTIFIIPWLFDDCEIPFRLEKYHHWVVPSSADPYSKLIQSLEFRATQLHLNDVVVSGKNSHDSNLELYLFNKIVAEEVPYTFYISKYPVTNSQYRRFLDSPEYLLIDTIWTEFPKFNQDGIQIGHWEQKGAMWLRNMSAELRLNPACWDDDDFGIAKPDHPVVGITWYEANAYCKWLASRWKINIESHTNPGLQPSQCRLPLEIEWAAAAGGESPENRYPWDRDGKTTKEDKEISRRANVNGNIGRTTSVGTYLRGASTYGVMDMGGNVWEWLANFYGKEEHIGMALRGGSWKYYQYGARVSRRYACFPEERLDDVGFRVVFTV